MGKPLSAHTEPIPTALVAVNHSILQSDPFVEDMRVPELLAALFQIYLLYRLVKFVWHYFYPPEQDQSKLFTYQMNVFPYNATPMGIPSFAYNSTISATNTGDYVLHHLLKTQTPQEICQHVTDSLWNQPFSPDAFFDCLRRQKIHEWDIFKYVTTADPPVQTLGDVRRKILIWGTSPYAFYEFVKKDFDTLWRSTAPTNTMDFKNLLNTVAQLQYLCLVSVTQLIEVLQLAGPLLAAPDMIKLVVAAAPGSDDFPLLCRKLANTNMGPLKPSPNHSNTKQPLIKVELCMPDSYLELKGFNAAQTSSRLSTHHSSSLMSNWKRLSAKLDLDLKASEDTEGDKTVEPDAKRRKSSPKSTEQPTSKPRPKSSPKPTSTPKSPSTISTAKHSRELKHNQSTYPNQLSTLEKALLHNDVTRNTFKSPTNVNPSDPRKQEAGRYLALDCEMVGVGPKGSESALARVSVVNYYGIVLYDEYVRPQKPITDYRTRYSGITAALLRNSVPFDQAQAAVLDLIRGRIVVGHDLRNDFAALKLLPPAHALRDTAYHKPFRNQESGSKRRLKSLVEEYTGISIQNHTHSSVEDSRAVMALFRMHRLQFEANNGKIKNSNKIENPPRAVLH